MNKIGIMLSETTNPNLPVLFKKSGLDFFIIDCEHGGFDYADVAKLVMTARLCGIEAIVRLSDNGRKDITKFADMGADGFILPMTSAPEDIAEVVRYALYPPVGMRGISTMRAHTLYSPPSLSEYIPAANARMKIFAEIETVEGVKNVDGILAVPGVAGAIMGPNDLMQDYDVAGKNGAAELAGAIEKVGAACMHADTVAGIITGNKNLIELAEKNGFSVFSRGSELNAIAEYCKKSVSDLKN